MKNRELAQIFERMGDILEFKGENVFKVNAYRKASRVLKDLAEDIEVISREGRLRQIPGVGEGIAKKIQEYLETGKVAKYEEIRTGVSEGAIRFLEIPGMGPKTAALVHTTLGIDNLHDLEEAVKAGKLRDLPGLGEKKEENILRGIRLLREAGRRISLGVALPLVEEVMEDLRMRASARIISPAGSLRRMQETVGDIDILAAGSHGEKIIAEFTRRPQVQHVLAAGDTKGSVIVQSGMQVDLRVVPEESYGAALQYFTGSKAHNVHLRGIARGRGMKISEYGIFHGEKRIGGRAEGDIYDALGLPWIPPELREDRGEIQAAGDGKLPSLVGQDDIRGDLHVHSTWSDGIATLEEIARRGRELGYEYVAVCDHSQSLKFAGGVSVEDLHRKVEEIEQLNRKLDCVTLLCGAEVDIKTDGTLDYPDDLLEKLDIVIAAIHTGFKQEEKQITRRIVSAMENAHVDIIAHPTGRLISSREPYRVDLNRILSTAAETGTALEINAYLDRLDLDDMGCRQAKEMGVKLAIGTDAHHVDQLWMMRLGVAVARRGWLEPGDLLNTLPIEGLRKFLGKRRRIAKK